MIYRVVEADGRPPMLHRDQGCSADTTTNGRTVSTLREIEELDIDTRSCRECFPDGTIEIAG